ncbi:MAG: uroporphyrinogen decarboxylase family protein [bacterium]
MDARTRILKTLRGEPVEGVPWSSYPAIIPTGQVERELRNRGMALIVSVPVCLKEMPNVQVTRREIWEDDQQFIYRTFHTPVGEVTEKRRVEEGYGSEWIVEYMIRRPEDYRVVEFMVRDTRLVENYKAIVELEENLGGDGLALAWATRSPYQQMFIELMGIERLALDRADGLREFESLREALEEQHQEIYRLAAKSPATLIWVPDNLTDWVAGRSIFESYYVPYYNRIARVLREAGKIMVTHMDGRLGSLAKSIGRTEIDVVEAFTPPPMGDLSVAEAKRAWPDKVIWSNFPGSVFLEEPDEIKNFTVKLLRESMVGGRFILGVTENIPHSVRRHALLAMADGIDEYARGT